MESSKERRGQTTRRNVTRTAAMAAIALAANPALSDDKPTCYTDQQMANVRLVQSIVGSGQTASYKTHGKPKFEYLRTVISDDYVADLSSGMPYGRQFRGWQGYQELSAEIKKFWSDLHMVDPKFVPLGDDKVIIHFTLDGVIAKSGQHMTMPVVSIWGIGKDGKANSFRVFYFDTKLVTDLAAKVPEPKP